MKWHPANNMYVLIFLASLRITSMQAQKMNLSQAYAGSLRKQSTADTLKSITFNGIQAELQGPVTFNQFVLSRQSILALNTGDPLIDQSFEGYKNSLYFSGNTQVNFNGAFAARCFFSVPSGKLPYLDVYAGLAYGSISLGNAGFYKESFDTSDVFSNGSGQNVFEINLNVVYNHFGVQAQKTNLIIGLNTGTKKHRWFWFTAGLELSPGLLFGYKYHSYSFYKQEKYLVSENNTDPLFYFPPRSASGGTTSEMRKSINKTGYYINGALPLTMNIRLSKKIKVLKQLHFSMQMAPGFIFANDQIGGKHSQFAFFTNVGFRYME